MDELPDISPFVAGEHLGQGSVGQVYRADDLAVRVIHPEIAGDAIVEILLANARAFRGIRHPHLVRIHDAGRLADGRPFIATEYIEGRTLAAVLGEEKVLPVARVARIGKQLCDALAALHNGGVMHLDLKPSKVMLTGDGEAETVKLMDPGFGATRGGVAGNLDLGPGTPEYWSPEHARGSADARSDIYGLGVILYEMLAGNTPFASDSVAEIIAAHLNSLPPEIDQPDTIAAPVLRCLAKKPANRFQTMEELRVAIEAAEQKLVAPRSMDGSSEWGAPSLPQPKAATKSEPQRRLWLLLAVAGVAAAALAIAQLLQ